MSVPQRPSVRAICLAAAMLFACPPPAPAEETPAQSDLVAAGNGSMLWIAEGTFDAEQRSFVQRFAYLSKAATQPRTLRIAPQIGRIRRAAAVGDGVNVFYDTGLHVRYTPQGDRREIQLPNRKVPLAMAGFLDQRRPRVLAVVESEVAGSLKPPILESAPAASETGDPANAAGTRPAIGPGGRYLIRYDSLSWTPVIALPESAESATWIGLAADGDQVWLAWWDNPLDHQIELAWLRDQQWTRGPSLQLDAPSIAEPVLGLINRRLVLAAMFDGQESQPQRLCRTWFLRPANTSDQAGWDPGGEFKDAEGETLLLEPGTAVTGFVESLAIARRSGDRVEYGLWSPSGGGPLSPFDEVPLTSTVIGPGSTQNVIGMITLIALLLILTMLFRHRPESLSEPVPLPPGIVLAGLARRLVATVVDMAPAACVVALLWREDIATWYEAVSTTGEDSAYLPPLPLRLVIARVTFVLIYTAWCTGFELAWHATPGKRLLGCRVISERDEPLTRRQILIRNLTRIVELEPYLNIWPFVLVTVITRNRQRAGDILARTLVVERRAIAAADDHEKSPSDSD